MGYWFRVFRKKPFNEEDIKIIKQDTFLAQAMESLLSDKKLNRHYRNQSARRIQDFSPQAITARWIDVIEN